LESRLDGLLDELHLFVNSTAIGAGMPVFGRDARQQLRLVTAQPFDCGITALHFGPRRSRVRAARL
jgi:dihydrofolate reductase